MPFLHSGPSAVAGLAAFASDGIDAGIVGCAVVQAEDCSPLDSNAVSHLYTIRMPY